MTSTSEAIDDAIVDLADPARPQPRAPKKCGAGGTVTGTPSFDETAPALLATHEEWQAIEPPDRPGHITDQP